MKFSLTMLFAFVAMALSIISCRNADEINDIANPEIAGLQKIKEIGNDSHIIELYSRTGKTMQGYNEISLRIKNKSTNLYENNVAATWLPMMHMTSMAHSCPASVLQKSAADAQTLSGYIVFQMPGGAAEFWDLTINYKIGEKSYAVTTPLNIEAETKKTVVTFFGSDNSKYVMANIAPESPKVAVNDWTVGLWKASDMMTYSVVDNYTIHVDPRMPAMGNHSAPNNVAAKQTGSGGFYKGKLALTMSGFWKLNLRVAAADGTILKGEEVTENTPNSSIFFELEF